MAYLCRDCGLKGKERGADGHCPACGSPRFLNARPQTSQEVVETRKGRLVLLAALWGALIYMIYQKLYGA